MELYPGGGSLIARFFCCRIIPRHLAFESRNAAMGEDGHGLRSADPLPAPSQECWDMRPNRTSYDTKPDEAVPVVGDDPHGARAPMAK